jgi:hypothetical protein
MGEEIQSKKNKYDVVLLERVTTATLDKPFTLWHALYMTKVNGQIVIDSCDYTCSLYDTNRRQDLVPVYGKVDESFDTKIFSSLENAQKQVEIYGLTPAHTKAPLQHFDQNICKKMVPIASFLSSIGCTDIMNANNAYSPYTQIPGQGLETARKTSILCATKTQATEDSMNAWAAKMYTTRGFILNYCTGRSL